MPKMVEQPTKYDRGRNIQIQNYVMDIQPKPPNKISITVALDASPGSLAALEISTALAKWMQAEICGVFVEDDNLVRLCELPFSTEIGAQSATSRYLTEFCITREFEVLKRAMQQRLEETATRYEVPWRFEVRQGPVSEQLLSAAKTTSIISFGRVGRSEKQQIGSSARRLLAEVENTMLVSGSRQHEEFGGTVTVLYTGTPAADRALRQAIQLVQNSENRLSIIVWPGEQDPASTNPKMEPTVEQLAQSATDQLPENFSNVSPIHLQKIEGRTVVDLLRYAWSVYDGMLVLPSTSRGKLSAWLDVIDIPVLLVP